MIKLLMSMALLVGTACIASAEPELSRRQLGDLAIQSRAILNKYCSGCHKADSPISSLSVLDHKQLVSLQTPVPFAAKGGPRSQILEFLDDGSMPPAGHERPKDAEIAVLRQWIAAKAPSYPKDFDPATTQRVLLDDFSQLAEKDRPFARYVSMAHLVPAGTEPPSLITHEFALQKAIAVATEAASPRPQPVDDSATLFRLDIRVLGWHASDLFGKVVDGSADGVFPMNAYDLILLEYPDAAPVTGPDGARLNLALSEMKQIRPIPFLKAEWLADALMNKTGPSQLAEELKSLVRLSTHTGKTKPVGVLNESFAGRKSIVSATPPLGAFYAKAVSSPAPPFPKLSVEVIDERGNAIKAVDTDDPFKLRIKADADGHFLVLGRWSNGELVIQPVEGGLKLKADQTRILSPKKKVPPFVFKISGLLNGQAKGTEHFIVLASPDEIPVPTIVRSQHSTFPVWRFLPAEPTKPGSVQRVVAELDVTKKP